MAYAIEFVFYRIKENVGNGENAEHFLIMFLKVFFLRVVKICYCVVRDNPSLDKFSHIAQSVVLWT